MLLNAMLVAGCVQLSSPAYNPSIASPTPTHGPEDTPVIGQEIPCSMSEWFVNRDPRECVKALSSRCVLAQAGDRWRVDASTTVENTCSRYKKSASFTVDCYDELGEWVDGQGSGIYELGPGESTVIPLTFLVNDPGNYIQNCKFNVI